MLSPGEWYKLVPKDPLGNRKFRLGLIRKAGSNRALQKDIIEVCKRDILFYINTFVIQINPKNLGSEVGPFITYDFQDRAVLETIRVMLASDYQDDMLWEKSREMGATWLALIVWDWCCLFHKRKKFLCISHSAEAVDRTADPDSLFWKIKFMHQYLPDWLKRGVKKRRMGFSYPATQSSINGAASTGRSGVGGRATAVLLDEFSKQQSAAEILGQTADTGPRLIIGTHYGIGTTYFDLTQRPDMHKIVMHWSQHPEKARGLYQCNDNKVKVIDKQFHYPEDFKYVMDGTPTGGPYPGLRSPWYDRECVRRANSRDVAMHLDINPQGSVSQVFDPLKIRQLKEMFCRPCLWRGEAFVDRQTGKLIALERAENGPLKLWINPGSDGKITKNLYFLGCDISTGNGASNSCISIGNINGERIGEYVTAHMDGKDLATVAVALGWLLVSKDGEPAKIAWEINGPGIAFGKAMIDLGYRHFYYRTSDAAVYRKAPADVPGWMSNNNTKRLLIEEYRMAIYTRRMTNLCEKAMGETLDFRYNTSGNIEHSLENSRDQAIKDPSGARANHGDRVIADALVWRLISEYGEEGRREIIEEVLPGSLAWRRQLHDNTRKEVWA